MLISRGVNEWPKLYGNPRSILGVAGGAREGDDVADIGQPAQEQNGALQTESEARVGHAAEAAQVEVPAVVVGVQPRLLHAAFEHVEALLALAAADDLADPRHQH